MSSANATTTTVTKDVVVAKLRALNGRRTSVVERIHGHQLDIATLKGLDNGQPTSDALTERDVQVHRAAKAANEALTHWGTARTHLDAPVDLSAANTAAESASKLLDYVEQQLDLAETGAMESTSSAQPKDETSPAPVSSPAAKEPDPTPASSQTKAQPQATSPSDNDPKMQPASADSASADTAGMEQRLIETLNKAVDGNFTKLKDEIAKLALPPAYQEVIQQYTPEQLGKMLMHLAKSSEKVDLWEAFKTWFATKQVPRKEHDEVASQELLDGSSNQTKSHDRVPAN